nr:hypothetical protein CFP56_68940 [Quercus suber]
MGDLGSPREARLERVSEIREKELGFGKGLMWVGHGGSMEELTVEEEELAAKVASMIEGNELEGSAMEFHMRQLK